MLNLEISGYTFTPTKKLYCTYTSWGRFWPRFSLGGKVKHIFHKPQIPHTWILTNTTHTMFLWKEWIVYINYIYQTTVYPFLQYRHLFLVGFKSGSSPHNVSTTKAILRDFLAPGAGGEKLRAFEAWCVFSFFPYCWWFRNPAKQLWRI